LINGDACKLNGIVLGIDNDSFKTVLAKSDERGEEDE
jgi:hypothetical protein